MADSSEQDALIAEFQVFTGGIDEQRARFFLESSGWELQVAVESFYDNTEDQLAVIQGGRDDLAPPVFDIPPSVEEIAPGEDSEEDNVIEIPPSSARPGPTGASAGPPTSEKDGGKNKKSTTENSSRIKTFSQYQRDSEKKESSSDEEGEAFYAGGGEHSGQQILGPSRKKGKKAGSSDIVDDMFKQAKEHGATEVTPEEQAASSRPSRVFKGTGYRLGLTENDTQVVEDKTAPAPKSITVVLKLWSNGFSLDNGELRDFKDPGNAEFLKAISKSEIPHELIQLAKGGEVNLDMEDHRNEEYVPPKHNLKPFTGAGHLLGSPTPSIVSNSARTTQNPSAAASSPTVSSVSVDTTQPVTSIQIRMADGTRLVSKFNHTHTITDIRQQITLSRPDIIQSNFVLMTTFPNKELTDESLTIAQANLMNAVVVLKKK